MGFLAETFIIALQIFHKILFCLSKSSMVLLISYVVSFKDIVNLTLFFLAVFRRKADISGAVV